jgi:signal transduction histidine kinase
MLRDVHAWLLREYRKPFIRKGWFKHFDKEIYVKEHHNRLIRAFIPIIAHNPDKDIGTLETGYNINRCHTIDDNQVQMLQALADQAAIVIRNHHLKLENIKSERLKLIPKKFHIVKNPASHITALLSSLENELKKPDFDVERIRRYVSLAKPSAHVLTLRTRALTVDLESDPISLKSEYCDIISLLKNQINEFIHYGKKIYLINHIDAKFVLQISLIEREMIQIVIQNLILNAVQHSRKNGKIILYVDHKDRSFKIGIKDDGKGFPPELLPSRIFQPSQTDKLTRVENWPLGTGLGLHTVQELVHKLRWNCKAINCETGGALVEITIPDGGR